MRPGPVKRPTINPPRAYLNYKPSQRAMMFRCISLVPE